MTNRILPWLAGGIAGTLLAFAWFGWERFGKPNANKAESPRSSEVKDAEKRPKGADYFPMGKGMEWIYSLELWDEMGLLDTSTTHRKVGSLEVYDGKSYYRIHTWGEGSSAGKRSVTLSRRDEGGIYSMDPKRPQAEEEIDAVFPLEVGRSWSGPSERLFERKNGAKPADTSEKTVVGFETITVNSTTYKDCCHVRVISTKWRTTENYWAAPGVGTVKWEILTSEFGPKVVMTLREFKPTSE
jgi:hypothetical protein